MMSDLRLLSSTVPPVPPICGTEKTQVNTDGSTRSTGSTGHGSERVRIAKWGYGVGLGSRDLSLLVEPVELMELKRETQAWRGFTQFHRFPKVVEPVELMGPGVGKGAGQLSRHRVVVRFSAMAQSGRRYGRGRYLRGVAAVDNTPAPACKRLLPPRRHRCEVACTPGGGDTDGARAGAWRRRVVRPPAKGQHPHSRPVRPVSGRPGGKGRCPEPLPTCRLGVATQAVAGKAWVTELSDGIAEGRIDTGFPTPRGA